MCKDCGYQSSLRAGTIFEGSKIPLSRWFAAIYPMCAFKRGISAYQVHIHAKITYKSAWFICHRIRKALAEERPLPAAES